MNARRVASYGLAGHRLGEGAAPLLGPLLAVAEVHRGSGMVLLPSSSL